MAVPIGQGLDERAVEQFKAGLRGTVIQLGEPGYEEARAVYNAMIDKYPALIVRVADVTDVIHAVNFARQQGLLLAVRGGGHNGPGLGTCEDGLVIDLSRMKGVFVDAQNKTVRAQGGCTWGDVDHAASAYGLATPSGFISTTGVGGLTLGGGIGYLSRAYGLTIDNLLSAEVVLADGRVVSASASENADLFWALRGGGGNFGVVTTFEFKAHSVSTVYGGPMLWPIARARQIMRFWRDLILSEPEDLNGWFGFHTIPPVAPFPEAVQGQKMCFVQWCYTGPMDQAEERLKKIRALEPVLDWVGPIPWPALQSMFDWVYPPGLQWYWKADFVTDLSDKAIDLHTEYAQQLPTPHSTMHLYPINGAVHRVGKNDTAFSYREANFASVIVGVDPDPANNPRMIQWAKDYWLALHPYSSGGGYINMMMDEGENNVKAAYRDNYDRLTQVKRKYDPDNLFRVNQNIRPA
ncbi:MAG TPA: FAD-binding oxidoreductase [Meiothermus sp.]|nr:FAD-binding oxidoreductase [Meiothermus sp.]